LYLRSHSRTAFSR